jgi:hypothetical protein
VRLLRARAVRFDVATRRGFGEVCEVGGGNCGFEDMGMEGSGRRERVGRVGMRVRMGVLGVQEQERRNELLDVFFIRKISKSQFYKPVLFSFAELNTDRENRKQIPNLARDQYCEFHLCF